LRYFRHEYEALLKKATTQQTKAESTESKEKVQEGVEAG
jgi:hypothetical protein